MISIRTAINCTNLTQQDLAEYFEVHKNTVNNWVNEHVEVSINQYQDILTYLADHLDEANLIQEIDDILADEKKYVLYNSNITNPELREISSYEIAEIYVSKQLKAIRFNFEDGILGRNDEILTAVAIALEAESDYMWSVQIAKEGELFLTARNVLQDLQIGCVDEIAEKYPNLFSSIDDVNTALDKPTDEQAKAICEYLRSQDVLLKNQDFDF